MSGGGSGGGGGSSGAVDYPSYMKERHSKLFDDMRSKADTAITSNPYVGMYGWSPECMIEHMQASVDYYDTLVQDFEPFELWKELINTVPTTVFGLLDLAPVDSYIDTAKVRLRDGIEDEVLPKYRRGMQNIGAVMTSAFKIGEALLWKQELQEEVALEKEFRGKLALAAYEYCFKTTGDIISLTLQKLALNNQVVSYNMESVRMAYVAMKEYTENNNTYEIERVKWPLEMSKYLMDALGSIASSAGTSYTTSTGGYSRTASGIGGALGGAASGAMLGSAFGGVGSAIGAVGGAAVGLISSLF